MRFLQGTKTYMFMHKRTVNLGMIEYSNLDFTRCIDSHKSTSSYVFMFANGVISRKSGKQTIVDTSIMEAQFVSYFEATSMRLKSSMFKFRIVDFISTPLRMFCDN